MLTNFSGIFKMKIIIKIKNRLRNYYRLIFLGDKFLPEVRRWFREQGNQELRLNYPLNANSVIFDVGGYEGEWAAQIYAKFNASIYIFEPVPSYSESIKSKFESIKNIYVYSYGLAHQTETLKITLSDDNSSFYTKTNNASINAEVREFSSDLLQELNVPSIDLMKINIEGAEYDLLEHMIENGTIKLVKNLQIQFHSFVPNAIARRSSIREKLKLTHTETWCYEFVWENWSINE